VSLAKFSDETKWIRAWGKLWCVHGHKQTPNGPTDLATVAIFAETTPDVMKEVYAIAPERRRAARSIGFGPSRRAKRKQVALDVLRRSAGRPVWREGWNPQPRAILGGIFDRVLLARALASVPCVGRATIEVLPMKVGHFDGHVLRVIARGWRLVLASRLDASAPPLDLATRSRSEAEKP
jgi:hypothetical protein